MENLEVINSAAYLKASKSLAFKSQVIEKYTSIFRFLSRNNLISINPFSENGKVRDDLVVFKSDLTPIGFELFKKAIPAWQRSVDKSGNYDNVSSLEKALEKLKS